MTADLEPHPIPDTGARAFGLSAWCVVAAFGVYFCTYAFRKPFAVVTYDDVTWGGLGYKTILITAQTFGYMLSKFIGIKVIAEMPPHRRAVGILVLIVSAEAALLLFALVPPPYNFVCLFLNGLPLGMVFGLVLGYLEGRRQTEALTAGLCASFILADGVMKSVGAYLIESGVGEYWMPAAAGLLFLPPLLLFVWMLSRIPAPTAADVARRTLRAPMTREDRKQFFARHRVAITLLVLSYVLITVLRSMRADFAPEIWTGLGITGQPGVFGQSEVCVSLGVMVICGLGVLIRDNRRAFFASLAVSLAGMLLVGVSLVGLQAAWLGPFGFMVLLGLGLYLPYVAMHTAILERLIAMTRERGNIGYLLYLADAFGYLGYVAVMLAKSLAPANRALPTGVSFLNFFTTASGLIAGLSALFLTICWLYVAMRPVKP